MVKRLTLLGAVAVGAVARGQTLDPGAVVCKRFDDGAAENSWKVNNPTGSGDFFHLDLDDDCLGQEVVGLCVVTNVTRAGAADGRVGLYPDSASDASGNTPDLGAPLSELVAPSVWELGTGLRHRPDRLRHPRSHARLQRAPRLRAADRRLVALVVRRHHGTPRTLVLHLDAVRLPGDLRSR